MHMPPSHPRLLWLTHRLREHPMKHGSCDFLTSQPAQDTLLSVEPSSPHRPQMDPSMGTFWGSLHDFTSPVHSYWPFGLDRLFHMLWLFLILRTHLKCYLPQVSLLARNPFFLGLSPHYSLSHPEASSYSGTLSLVGLSMHTASFHKCLNSMGICLNILCTQLTFSFIKYEIWMTISWVGLLLYLYSFLYSSCQSHKNHLWLLSILSFDLNVLFSSWLPKALCACPQMAHGILDYLNHGLFHTRTIFCLPPLLGCKYPGKKGLFLINFCIWSGLYESTWHRVRVQWILDEWVGE